MKTVAATPENKTYNVAIIGGGILGTALAYWLSTLYEHQEIVVIEKENDVGFHTSSRNTGVVHRPFYLDPEKKKTYARASLLSYPLWEKYAKARKLPWAKIGTIEVATNEADREILMKYKKWALENGMRKEEVEVLNQKAVEKLEPNIKCAGAIFCKTDAATDFGLLTRSLKKDAQDNGVRFFMNSEVEQIKIQGEELNLICKDKKSISTRYLINCAGGNAVKIAHLLGVACEFTDFNFRGEYWVVNSNYADLAKHNIYSVPRHKEFPFLDPHWVIRWDGLVEIGPTAIPVFGPYAYKGFFETPLALFRKISETPRRNKLKLLVNPVFLQLALEEWKSSFSKKSMAQRVRKFLPGLRADYLTKQGSAGIRSSVIDKDGHFAKEALEFFGPYSFHILNFNSPGATGAPAYTAHLVERLRRTHRLNHLKKRSKPAGSAWDYEGVIRLF